MITTWFLATPILAEEVSFSSVIVRGRKFSLACVRCCYLSHASVSLFYLLSRPLWRRLVSQRIIDVMGDLCSREKRKNKTNKKTKKIQKNERKRLSFHSEPNSKFLFPNNNEQYGTRDLANSNERERRESPW